MIKVKNKNKKINIRVKKKDFHKILLSNHNSVLKNNFLL